MAGPTNREVRRGSDPAGGAAVFILTTANATSNANTYHRFLLIDPAHIRGGSGLIVPDLQNEYVNIARGGREMTRFESQNSRVGEFNVTRGKPRWVLTTLESPGHVMQ